MNYIDYICIAVCVLHFVVSFISSLIQRKKINMLCDKCNSPIVEGEQHDCELTSSQLKALTNFILELKKSEVKKDE